LTYAAPGSRIWQVCREAENRIVEEPSMKRTTSLAAAALLACSLVGCAPKSLLLVTQYPDDSPRVAEAVAAIRARMGGENTPFHLMVYNANLVGRESEAWRTDMVRVAMANVHAAEPCIVFAQGDLVARDFVPKAVELSNKVIFFDVVGDPGAYKPTDSDLVTGISAPAPVAELFALMKQIVPSARTAAVLADESIVGEAVVAQIERASNLPIRVVQVKRAGTMDEWMAAVKDIQGQADVLVIGSYMEVRKDASAPATVPVPEILLATSQANRLPDFSFWKDAVGANGVLGAVTVPISTQARQAARVAAMVLYYGEDFRDEPIRACEDRATITNADRAMQLGVKLPELGAASAAPPAKAETPAEPATPPAEPAPVAPAQPEVTPK
jgi:ABC-type uncharacterized transport system substrate-binding protein